MKRSRDAAARLRAEALRFVNERATGRAGEYGYSVEGAPNLYSSCYALMTLQTLDALPADPGARAAWAEYLGSWQEAESGYFVGPELGAGVGHDKKHDPTHLRLHLTTTVLPCLDLLDVHPKHALGFAAEYLSEAGLASWLDARDFSDAWLEGNNLLFVLQVLIHCRDVEARPEAPARIEQFFAWLDARVDPATGLWGSDGLCSPFVAMCGGYHQLLAYYYEGRPVRFPESLVDTTLDLQHSDGGFHQRGGGGACEDADAVDILVNLYKLHDYRREDIRYAIGKALEHLVRMQMPDGGFVYRKNEAFTHMGIPDTKTSPNHSNMFATWFRVHTIALCCEILAGDPLADYAWGFNRTLSMGWHPAWTRAEKVSGPRGSRSQELARALRWHFSRRLRALLPGRA